VYCQLHITHIGHVLYRPITCTATGGRMPAILWQLHWCHERIRRQWEPSGLPYLFMASALSPPDISTGLMSSSKQQQQALKKIRCDSRCPTSDINAMKAEIDDTGASWVRKHGLQLQFSDIKIFQQFSYSQKFVQVGNCGHDANEVSK